MEESMGMREEIDAALEAHALWRKRFKDYLAGRAPFDVDRASATDRCGFGHWLDREGYRLMPTELHAQIREAHAAFHHVAAEVIRAIKEKRFADAHKAIAVNGAFDRASARLAYLMRRATLKEPRGARAPAAAGEAPPAEPLQAAEAQDDAAPA
jgi:hypothetical protein